MPSAKRERQKQGRAARQEAIKAAQRRRAMQRRLLLLAIPAAIFAFLVARSVLSGDDNDNGTTDVAATNTEKAAPCPKVENQERRATFEAPQRDCIDEGKSYTARVKTDVGDFTIALDAKRAPTTVNNFVVLARYHFYDGLTFHRVVKDFVIQGGDPAGNGSGGPGYTIAEEAAADTKYPAGSVAMAKTAQPNSTGSQFFVVTHDAGGASLQPQYSRFGTVTEGMDVVKRIEADAGEPPATIHKIISITIEER